MENLEIVNIDTSKSEKSLLQLNKEMKVLSKTLKQLDKDSEEYNKVLNKLSQTQNTYANSGKNVQVSLKNTADKIDGITKTIGGAVGAFSTITSSMNLLGLSGSDAEKELLKIVNILNLMKSMSALKDIPEGLLKITESFKLFNKQSETVKASTDALNATTALETTSQNANTGAVVANAAASASLTAEQLKLAESSTLTAIAFEESSNTQSLLTEKLLNASDAYEDLHAEIISLDDAIENATETLKELSESAEANAGSISYLKAEIEGLEKAKAESITQFEELRDTMDETQEQINKTKNRVKDLNDTLTMQQSVAARSAKSFKGFGDILKTFFTGIIKQLKALKVALLSNPITAIIVGLTAAVTLFITKWDKISKLWSDTKPIEAQSRALKKLEDDYNRLKYAQTQQITALEREQELRDAMGKDDKESKKLQNELQLTEDLYDALVKLQLTQETMSEPKKGGWFSSSEDYEKQKKIWDDQQKTREEQLKQQEAYRLKIEELQHKITVAVAKETKERNDKYKAEAESLRQASFELDEIERQNALALRERLNLFADTYKNVTYDTEGNITKLQNEANIEIKILEDKYKAELAAFKLTAEEEDILTSEYLLKKKAIEQRTADDIRDIRRGVVEEELANYEQMLSAQMTYTQEYYAQREGSAIDSALFMQEAFALDAAWKLREEYFEKTMALYAKDSAEYKKLEQQKTKEAKINATARKNAETASIRAGMDFASQAFGVISGLSKEGTKIAKASASAGVIIDGVAASIGLFRGYAPLGPLGIVPLIAQQALLAGQTALALKQIWATSDSGSTSPDLSSSMIAPSIPTVQNVLTSSDIEAQASSMSQMQMFVSVTDINDMQNKVEVTDRESRF